MICENGILFCRLDEPTWTSHRSRCNDLWSDHCATAPNNFLRRMSSMISLFRPLLLRLLCYVIALGQLPVLLHVASCGGHAHCQRVGEDKNPSQVCSHGCHKNPSDNSVDGEKNEGGLKMGNPPLLRGMIRSISLFATLWQIQWVWLGILRCRLSRSACASSQLFVLTVFRSKPLSRSRSRADLRA